MSRTSSPRRCGFTLVELQIVIAIIAIVIVIVAAALHKDTGTATVTASPPGAPEALGSHNVYVVPLGFHFSSEGALIRDKIAGWLREHPGERVVSIIRTSGESGSDLVIVSYKEAGKQ